MAGTRCSQGLFRSLPRGVVMKLARTQCGFEFRSHRVLPSFVGRDLLFHGGDVLLRPRRNESAPGRGAGVQLRPPEGALLRHVIVRTGFIHLPRPVRQVGNMFFDVLLGRDRIVVEFPIGIGVRGRRRGCGAAGALHRTNHLDDRRVSGGRLQAGHPPVLSLYTRITGPALPARGGLESLLFLAYAHRLPSRPTWCPLSHLKMSVHRGQGPRGQTCGQLPRAATEPVDERPPGTCADGDERNGGPDRRCGYRLRVYAGRDDRDTGGRLVRGLLRLGEAAGVRGRFPRADHVGYSPPSPSAGCRTARGSPRAGARRQHRRRG